MLRAAAGDSTWSPDRGHRPPLANEAAIAAPDSQVISVEAHYQRHVLQTNFLSTIVVCFVFQFSLF